jgi:hypothetical protein
MESATVHARAIGASVRCATVPSRTITVTIAVSSGSIAVSITVSITISVAVFAVAAAIRVGSRSPRMRCVGRTGS